MNIIINWNRVKYIGSMLTVMSLLAVSILWGSQVEAQAPATITGDLMQWHRVTLSFDGPQMSEADALTFWDYRLNVIFSNGQQTYVVPGFFAADGDAGNTGATSGNQWRAYFTPDATGEWAYTASFRTGSNISIDLNPNAGTPTGFDGSSGTFNVGASTALPGDFRYHGMLNYTGGHHLQFAGSGDYYLKAGVDSPENFLAYHEFDGTFDTGGVGGTNFLHQYSNHVGDWAAGDPTWGTDARGKGIIGAVNYLSGQGVNSIYFLTYNIDTGDGSDTWVWTEPNSRDTFDVSKLDQWEVVFSHMTARGVQLHVVIQETENDGLLGGSSGLNPVRQLYYRELVARFSHNPAVQWNIGEENSNTPQEQRDSAAYIRSQDPYNHPIALHIGYNAIPFYDNHYGDPNFDATSIQGDAINYNSWAIDIRNSSIIAGRPWVIYGDEQGPQVANNLNNLGELRRDALWGNLMGGGAGVEWYFGYQADLHDLFTEDFRLAQGLWEDSDHAVDFFQSYVPFHEMNPDNGLASSGYTLAKPGNTYVVYLPSGGTASLMLQDSSVYDVFWYNPRTGGALQTGSVSQISGVGAQSLGNPPNEVTSDWAVLVRLANAAPVINPINNVSLDVDSTVDVPVTATDADGNATITLTAQVLDMVNTTASFASFVDNGDGTGLLTLSPVSGDDGSYTGVITANDGTNQPVIETFTVTVNVPDTNGAPVFAVLAPIPAYDSGDTIVPYTVLASDPDSDPILYTAANLPDGLRLDVLTGLISGTITATPGTYPVILVITDDGNPNLSDVVILDWVVGDASINDAPIIDPIADRTSINGDAVSFFVIASDNEMDSLTYGASALPSGLSINAGTGEISGIINTVSTDYNVVISVTDNINSPVLSNFVWTVQDANVQPVLTSIADQSTEQGSSVNLQVIASDSNAADVLTYSASGLPAGLSINVTSGLISGIVTANANSYNVQVTVTDSVTPAVSTNFIWTITAPVNLPPTVANPGDKSNVEGASVSLQIVASDPELQPLSYSATGLPGGLNINVNTGLISGTVATGAATASPYAVQVTVSDAVNPVVVNFSWTITAPVNLPPTVTNPGDKSNVEGASVSLQIVASDPELQPLSYSATGLPGGLSINVNTGLISGTVATGAATASPYAVQVTVSDAVNPVAVNFSWTINPNQLSSYVSSLSLIDAQANVLVPSSDPLLDGTVISLGDYPEGINIVANTVGTITRINFEVNGLQERSEGVAPYAIGGDIQPDYHTWNIAPGTYTITAIPENSPAGSFSVTITITN